MPMKIEFIFPRMWNYCIKLAVLFGKELSFACLQDMPGLGIVKVSTCMEKVPQDFLSSFTEYLNKMYEMGKIPKADFHALSLMVFSSTFGYTFLKASG